MTRIVAIVALLLAALAVLVAVLRTPSGAYQVRAIFDHAGYVIPGEDVRVAGVKVGKISAVELTRDNRAAVVLDITEPGYQDFRADASCLIRPQSLLGEKFVECKPTQPHLGPLPPSLARIAKGPGAGQHLLPLAQTGKAVDLDLINNIMRRPYAERLSLIINELGTGLAGRGRDLAAVIRRADPALGDFDRLVSLLANQNRTLATLVRDAEAVAAPLARERKHVSGFVSHAANVGAATVARRAAVTKTLQLLPRFLRELRTTMQRLAGLSDQMTPVLSDVGAVAPQLSQMIEDIGPFARAGTPALRTLGEAAETGTKALTEARPALHDLAKFASSFRPVAHSLAPLLESLRKTGGIERLMDFIFYQVSAINGFDSLGHYMRTALTVNTCATYATKPSAECLAKFAQQTKRTAASAASQPQSNKAARLVTTEQQRTAGRPPSKKSASEDADGLLDYLLGGDE